MGAKTNYKLGERIEQGWVHVIIERTHRLNGIRSNNLIVYYYTVEFDRTPPNPHPNSFTKAKGENLGHEPTNTARHGRRRKKNRQISLGGERASEAITFLKRQGHPAKCNPSVPVPRCGPRVESLVYTYSTGEHGCLERLKAIPFFKTTNEIHRL